MDRALLTIAAALVVGLTLSGCNANRFPTKAEYTAMSPAEREYVALKMQKKEAQRQRALASYGIWSRNNRSVRCTGFGNTMTCR